MWLEILAVRVRMGEDDGVGLRVFLLSRGVTLGDFGGTARPTGTLAHTALPNGRQARGCEATLQDGPLVVEKVPAVS